MLVIILSKLFCRRGIRSELGVLFYGFYRFYNLDNRGRDSYVYFDEDNVSRFDGDICVCFDGNVYVGLG